MPDSRATLYESGITVPGGRNGMLGHSPRFYISVGPLKILGYAHVFISPAIIFQPMVPSFDEILNFLLLWESDFSN